MKRQQKLSVFFKQKRMAVEDGVAEDVSSTLSQPPELHKPKASSSTSTVRKYQYHSLTQTIFEMTQIKNVMRDK